MSLREAIAANSHALTTADRRIIDVLMVDLRESAFMAANDVAARAGVHESTVVRFAQKLGLAGYPELRDIVRSDVQRLDGSQSHLIGMPDDSTHDLRTLVRAEAQALMRLPDHLHQDEIDEAARRILAAGTVYVHGDAQVAPLTGYFERRLRMLGRRTVLLPSADLAERVTLMGPGDIVFLVALRRLGDGERHLLDHARRVGAGAVVVTSVHGLELDPESTTVLLAPRGDDNEFRTQVVPHLVCYALQLSIFHQEPEHARAALDAVERLKQSAPKHSPAPRGGAEKEADR